MIIEIAIREIHWTYSDQSHLNVELYIKVSYYGEYPPEGVFITTSLPDTNPESIGPFFDLTASLGPWVNANSNYWVLNSTMDNENLAHLPAYQFSLVVDNDWPNEKWGDVIIFLAHTPRTISGGVNSQIRGKLVTVNKNPDLHDYYWLWANMPLSNESVILHEKGATPTSDDPIGTYFSLVMSHELTSAESFSHLPFLLNVLYPLLSLLFIFVAIISTIKDSKRLIGTLLAIDATLIVFLLTMKYWISDYVPVWERSINSTIDCRLLWMVILLVVIVFIYMFAGITYSKLMDAQKE